MFARRWIPLSALTSCRAGKTEYSDSDYFVVNANMKLRLASSGASDDVLNSASAAAQKIASDIEKELSVNIAGTPAELFNSSDGGTEDPDGVFSAVLKTALDLAAATDGAYDPTIGRTFLSLWNINGGGPVPSEESIGDALSHVGYGKVSLENGNVYKDDHALRVDLGGIGKGYAVQKIVEYLPTAGVKYGLCSFGSTVGVFGSKPDGKKFRITVCDPDSCTPRKTRYPSKSKAGLSQVPEIMRDISKRTGSGIIISSIRPRDIRRIPECAASRLRYAPRTERFRTRLQPRFSLWGSRALS